MEPKFTRFIGIDYSGAVTPESSCKGSACSWPMAQSKLEQVLSLLLFENDIPVWNPERMRNHGEYFVFDKRG